MKFRMFSPHFVIAKDNHKPYLRRWFLTPWSDDSHKLKRRRLPNIYLHQILQSDDDRALHDHPWNNLSIILKGGYDEYVFERPPYEGVEMPNIIVKRRKRFQIIFRKADVAHRLELFEDELGNPKPCWTIFITWRKTKEWGFWCSENKIIGVNDIRVWTTDTIVRLGSIGRMARWVHYKIFIANNGCGE